MSTRRHMTAAQSAEIEESVIGYLERHPHARDTLEGIVSWWLPLQRYIEAKDLIGCILDKLVVEGQLARKRLPDGSHLYSLKSRTN